MSNSSASQMEKLLRPPASRTNSFLHSHSDPTSKPASPIMKGAAQSAFIILPTELHLQIASYLTYPDALSLKHAHRRFYSIVYTGVNLKIEWLIERRTLHLDCLHDQSCELGSDTRFCRGSVRFVHSSAWW